jgi:hypothetical protein
MKLLRLLAFPLAFAIASAAETFPGLRQIMTEAEWKRAGLDRLTPDQIGVIDAALIRHHRHTLETSAQRPSTTGSSASVSSPARAGFWEKFGLGKSSSTPDWRNQPPLIAKVTAWRGANGFVLENGQVWEGIENIPFELPGRTVTIEARPMDSFALKLNEQSVAVRVRRVK